MAQSNCMRNLSGGGVAVTRGCRGHPLAPRPGPPVPPAPFTPVAPGCCCVGSLDICLAFGTKFSLLGFLVVRTVQNSPCMSKKRQIEPFRVSWESFVPEVGPCGSCWESFVPHMRCEGCAGRVLYRSGAAWFLLGEICFVVAPSVYAVAGFPPPTGAPSWPSAPAARSTLVAVGVLHYTKPSTGVSPACRTLL